MEEEKWGDGLAGVEKEVHSSQISEIVERKERRGEVVVMEFHPKV